MKRKLTLLFLFVLCYCHFTNAQVFYVDGKNGNDQSEGSKANPFKSIEKAVSVANMLTGNGDVSIKIFPGIYTLQDKIAIHPLRAFSDTSSFTIEAAILPENADWEHAKMPVIQSVALNNSDTQFPHSTAFLVASDYVKIKGLKFIGNANPEITYYYPITRESNALKNLTVENCYFIAEKNSTFIQGGIWAHGEEIKINQCVFYNCKNAILTFSKIKNTSVTNSIIHGAYESAFWIGDEDPEFEFKNNVISNCNFVFTIAPHNKATFNLSNSVICDNAYYFGEWNREKGKVIEIDDYKVKETDITKKGKVKLVEREIAGFPENFLQLTPESTGYQLNASIFEQ
ncbi:right-handed parallel beta-helix repeat-containing protein [Chondrinema litorale]|uniref:right-handed parallel beta-helix repeat-containing protein n=1 Tax=Chondrinema litorale TaxID=2994555 RepID=UPI002542A3A6|nr:right-handed parallel beta-helix repeat-containing protein [Chondrinema litorale]UZR99430.1 right-handed parallel beta-helix repeat-containing protein [Chondrinema litorale]